MTQRGLPDHSTHTRVALVYSRRPVPHPDRPESSAWAPVEAAVDTVAGLPWTVSLRLLRTKPVRLAATDSVASDPD